MHKSFPWPPIRRMWDTVLNFLLLLPLRSWHTYFGELQPVESNRKSEEKGRTPFGSCRPIDIIHMGDNEISLLFSPQGPPTTTATWKERHTGSYEVPAICPLLKLYMMMSLCFCRSSWVLKTHPGSSYAQYRVEDIVLKAFFCYTPSFGTFHFIWKLALFFQCKGRNEISNFSAETWIP